jgi:hypothetical protein
MKRKPYPTDVSDEEWTFRDRANILLVCENAHKLIHPVVVFEAPPSNPTGIPSTRGHDVDCRAADQAGPAERSAVSGRVTHKRRVPADTLPPTPSPSHVPQTQQRAVHHMVYRPLPVVRRRAGISA